MRLLRSILMLNPQIVLCTFNTNSFRRCFHASKDPNSDSLVVGFRKNVSCKNSRSDSIFRDSNGHLDGTQNYAIYLLFLWRVFQLHLTALKICDYQFEKFFGSENEGQISCAVLRRCELLTKQKWSIGLCQSPCQNTKDLHTSVLPR